MEKMWYFRWLLAKLNRVFIIKFLNSWSGLNWVEDDNSHDFLVENEDNEHINMIVEYQNAPDDSLRSFSFL